MVQQTGLTCHALCDLRQGTGRHVSCNFGRGNSAETLLLNPSGGEVVEDRAVAARLPVLCSLRDDKIPPQQLCQYVREASEEAQPPARSPARSWKRLFGHQAAVAVSPKNDSSAALCHTLPDPSPPPSRPDPLHLNKKTSQMSQLKELAETRAV